MRRIKYFCSVLLLVDLFLMFLLCCVVVFVCWSLISHFGGKGIHEL